MTEPPKMAPAHPQVAPARRGLAKWWGVPFVAVALLVLLAIVGFALVPAQVVADKDVPDPAREGATITVDTPFAVVPAGVQPVGNRVSYDDLGDDILVDSDPDGLVFFVTISEPQQSMLGWWVAQDEPEIEFTTYEEKYGSRTPSQQRTISLQMMRTSGQVAQYVALTRAGYDARIIPGPVQIEQMLCVEIVGTTCEEFVPTAEQLDEGDILAEVNGVAIGARADLDEALADKQPGDTVAVTVERIEVGEVTVEVELLSASDDPESPDYRRPLIGFVPFDTASIDLPFEIGIDTGEIGGPSAGLAFTLTLIDELTDGSLLGGLDVAATGTIELDGSVGAIGRLPQKVSAVRQAGIGHFLVPASQPEASLIAAREIAGDDVEIVTVATVDEALAVLVELGGDPLPTAERDE